MNIAIINCFDTYEHRVDLLFHYFELKGNNVLVYTSNYKHIEKIKRNDKKRCFIYFNAIPYKKNMSMIRLFSHHKLARDIFKRVEYQKIDFLWVLIPPNSFVKEATKYKMTHQNVKLVFDVIDMWPETMPINKVENLYPIKKWKVLRDNYISKADYVVTECDLYQEKLVNLIEIEKMSTIYLAREIKQFKSNLNLPKDKISLCYLGSINNIIDISTIENIIKTIMIEKPVVLHIIGDGENKEKLIKCIKKTGADVVFHGKIYNETEKQSIFDQCHFGLNIMKDSVFVGLTMKSIDYFEGGLPIINNIKGDTWNIVDDNKIGFNFEGSFKKYECERNYVRVFYEKNFGTERFYNKLEIIYLKLFK